MLVVMQGPLPVGQDCYSIENNKGGIIFLFGILLGCVCVPRLDGKVREVCIASIRLSSLENKELIHLPNRSSCRSRGTVRVDKLHQAADQAPGDRAGGERRRGQRRWLHVRRDRGDLERGKRHQVGPDRDLVGAGRHGQLVPGVGVRPDAGALSPVVRAETRGRRSSSLLLFSRAILVSFREQVILPTPTQECLENRVDVEKRCAPDATDFELYGDEKGACDEPSVFLMKVAVGNFQSSIAENANPKSRMSPAYDVYKDFSITTLQLDQILTEWTNRGQDKFNFDLRFATCKWMAENLEEVIESVIPPSHPQIFERVSKTNPLAIIALVFSCIAIMITLGVSCAMGRKHHQGKIGRAAQIEFLALLLAGLLLVSVGSLLMALEPTNGTCVASVWMINVGYITQLVPTMIRVSAILKIVRASRKMKFVTVDKKKLIRRSLGKCNRTPFL